MAAKNIDHEEQLFESDDSSEIPPLDIIAYNELRSCADLYRMYTKKILDIQPAFQREVVWKGPEQTRFIDSLTKELPIPSLCFAQDGRKQEWIVIDGLQRMATIVKFMDGKDLDGKEWKLSKLDDVDEKISGVPVSAIMDESSELHSYYTRVENLSIPITVLRCDFSKKNHMEYLFTIFHRLNSGGAKLSNQEIRHGIFGGILNDLLGELDLYSDWRKINKIKTGGKYRYKYQEVMLRFFSMFDSHNKDYKIYDGNLSKYLNGYMHDHRNPKQSFVDEKTDLFRDTVNIIWNGALLSSPSKSKIPITILEAMMVGVAKNRDYLNTLELDDIHKKYQAILSHSVFSEESRKEGLSKKDKVTSRIDTAVEIFSDSSAA